MSRPDFFTELCRRPMLCDGAMGTQLIAQGLPPGACGELWNLERPDAVEAIHRAYRAAGCDLLTTNTFGASRTALERHGLASQVAALNRAGAQAARRGGGDDAWVLGDIGPFGGFLEPLGDMTADELLAIFTDQAAALQAGGADGLIIETMVDPNEMAVAVKAGRALGDWPIIATYAFNRAEIPAGALPGAGAGAGAGAEFRTMMGTTVRDAVRGAIDAGADMVGANCGTSLSLDDYLRLAERLVAAVAAVSPATPIILQPNAGSPQMIDGKLVHPASPADMAALVPALLDIGVRIVGGCCGTTPDHLRAMGQTLRVCAR